MGKNNKTRAGRHCLAVLLVHLVFLTKERGKVLEDATAIGILKESFAKVCIDFEAELIEMRAEHDHVHLVVAYPAKVAVSALVNSLKSVSSRMLGKHRPGSNALWSASYLAVSVESLKAQTDLIIKRYVEDETG